MIFIKNKRIEWIDIAKGIAIILVVIGHSPATNGIKTFIYGFHIPLFFFLSGFVFNPQKFSNSTEFFKNKIKTIVMPYLIFSLIEYLIYVLWENSIYNTNYYAYSIFKGILYASADTLKMYPVLWFLPCLFVVQCAFFLLVKINGKKTYLIISLITFSIVGFLYSQYSTVRLPWFIDSSLTAVVFYGIGFIYKTYDFYLESKLSAYYTELLIGSFALLYFCTFMNTTVDMFGLVYNNYFFYYTSAISGILFCIVLSKLINHSKTLTYLGKNTMLIFVFHVNMFNIVNYILGYIRNTYSIQFTVVLSAKWSLFYTSLSIILLIPVIIITSKLSRALKNSRTTKHVKDMVRF
ncbi:acyltransferase family protein [Aneurinibacillus uraniidurans]|uniref:acyltransferase family protein n=1 Tax=Aneurinibacillus uraniidurans TaxID=2966586 RepID=UPI003BEEEAAC